MLQTTVCLILVFAVHLSLGVPEDRFTGWTVKIIWKKEIVCAGTIINNKFFLTLRDCINEKKIEDYTVVVGEEEVRDISYILESPDDGDVVTVRLSEKVMIAQPDIASIPKVANKAQIVKARQNKRENYISGIDSTGDDLFLKINVLPDNKCKGGFTRGEHLCFAEMSKDEEESACSLMPGSPIVSYIGQSWTLLGLASFSKRCKGQQKKALNIVSYRRWINKIISLKAGSVCTSNDDCGENMKCEKNMCGCTYCYESVDEKCEVSDKKVLVLGAGMAGIMAAKTLGESGCSNVQILEATNRTGGRIQSVNISGYMMELGAQWIYGLGSNPIAALADQYGFEIVEEFDTWVVRDKFGNNVTAKADNDWYHIVDVLEKVRRFSRKLHRDGEPDITAEALLRKFGWNPVDNVAEAVEVYQLDVENGRETPSVSGKYLNNLRVFEEHGSDDWMISSDPRGYSYIIDELVRSFRDGQRILFNKKVTSIENWDDENTLVEVYTEDGSRYEADDVIITFSLGVLQSRQVNFEPPLSGKKMMAIDKFGFGKYTQMYFQFSSAFWDNTSTIVYAGDRHGESSVWYNMNSVFPGSNILQLALSGFEAETAERMTDAEVIESSMTVLRSMYPAANISGPIMFKKPNWQFDTTTLGSHSYWTTGFTYEDMDYLGMPEGHLHFAGDYISQTNYGYVHTSYNSGKNTALDLAGSVNL